MSSTHALESLSLASRNAILRRLFSRCVHSVSTSIPKRSSKDRLAISGLPFCSFQAAAMASSRMALSFSVVGSFSMISSVVIVRAADILVIERRRRFTARRNDRQWLPIQTVLQDRFDVPIGPRTGDQRALTRSLDPLGRVAPGQALEAATRAIPV